MTGVRSSAVVDGEMVANFGGKSEKLGANFGGKSEIFFT
jgi:hypothetical protein